MNIKKATKNDLDEIMEIYAYARTQMKKNGNPSQWGNNNPPRKTVENDIKCQNCYIIEENGIILGVFSFIIGNDETYKIIEGKWLNDDKYGTIHRVASNGMAKGLLELCLNFCESMIPNIRIDTHENNKIMQHLLEKNGYIRCGIIYVQDGTSRIAYQKCIK